MSLFKKAGSPFWWYDIRVTGHPRKRGSTRQTSKEKARQVESALIHQLSAGERMSASNKSPLLREYAVVFLEYVKQSRRSIKTKDYYNYGWSLLKNQPVADMRIDRITTSTTDVISIPWAGSTVNCALRTLRRILSVAEESGLIRKVPKIHLVEENERETVVDPQIETIILGKTSRTLHDIYLLMADCGIRPSDAVAIDMLEDVDFVKREIDIAGGKTGKKGRRKVSMSQRVYEMMLDRARRGKRWAFPSTKKKRAEEHIQARGVSTMFAKFKRENALPADVVLYSARHTFATDITEATGNPVKTQKALGHTQLSTAMRYIHSRALPTGSIMDARNQERHTFGHSPKTTQ